MSLQLSSDIDGKPHMKKPSLYKTLSFIIGN